ncbi:MAG: hypothetical protein KBC91_03290 [Candidatus Omnitrophica bacterium]|nr:hypothetical protein [Candidatus Omnitrophota bacterium]
MIRFLSYVIIGLMIQTSFSANLNAEPAVTAPRTALEEFKFDNAWGQKGSIWDGSAVFLANGLRRQQAGPPFSETNAVPKEKKKESQALGLELDRKFRAARLIAISS